MGWKQINNENEEGNNSGGIFKFHEVGQSLEGKWEGVSEGKFGEFGQIEGTKFPMHAVLAKALEDLEEGTLIKIVYKGMKKSKIGREYKNFDIFKEDF